MHLEQGARRRRGKELEDAILGAAWDQLVEGGYPNFTIDAVADRADTSRSVIYRRWADADTLLTASIAFGLRATRAEVPDTGTLRTDVIELMRRAGASRAPFVPLLSVLLGTYFSERGMSLDDLRQQMFSQGPRSAMDEVLDRAVARGEVDSARLTPRVRSVAFDLFRHDLLLTLKPLEDEEIIAIVDEIFLPLVVPLERT